MNELIVQISNSIRKKEQINIYNNSMILNHYQELKPSELRKNHARLDELR